MSEKSILIVDDESEMLKLLRIELEAEHYRVLTAQNAAGALQLMKDNKPDLVLLDVMMSDMDGYEMLSRIKHLPGLHKTPVIMVTAKGLEQDIQKGLDLGADDYIVRPFSPALLLKRIQLILNTNHK